MEQEDAVKKARVAAGKCVYVCVNGYVCVCVCVDPISAGRAVAVGEVSDGEVGKETNEWMSGRQQLCSLVGVSAWLCGLLPMFSSQQ